MPYRFIKVPVEDLTPKLPPPTENWDKDPSYPSVPVEDLTNKLPPPTENWDEKPVASVRRIQIEPVEDSKTCNKTHTEFSTVWNFESDGSITQTKTPAYSYTVKESQPEPKHEKSTLQEEGQRLFTQGKYRNRDWAARAKHKKWW